MKNILLLCILSLPIMADALNQDGLPQPLPNSSAVQRQPLHDDITAKLIDWMKSVSSDSVLPGDMPGDLMVKAEIEKLNAEMAGRLLGITFCRAFNADGKNEGEDIDKIRMDIVKSYPAFKDGRALNYILAHGDALKTEPQLIPFLHWALSHDLIAPNSVLSVADTLNWNYILLLAEMSQWQPNLYSELIQGIDDEGLKRLLSVTHEFPLEHYKNATLWTKIYGHGNIIDYYKRRIAETERKLEFQKSDTSIPEQWIINTSSDLERLRKESAVLESIKERLGL